MSKESETSARIAEYAKRVAAEAPPLSPAQIDQLVTLLCPKREQRHDEMRELRQLHDGGQQ